jgi:hypothetical protein
VGSYFHSYVFAHPHDLTDTAAHQDGKIWMAPLDKHPVTGMPLLLATAKIYGEFVRLNLEVPRTAVYTRRGNQVRIENKSRVTGVTEAAITRTDSTSATISGDGALEPSANRYRTIAVIPSISTVFPGFTLKDLQHIADDSGGIDILPNPPSSLGGTGNAQTYSEAISRPAFYVLNGNTELPSNNSRILQGVGLVVIDGNLTIQAGNLTEWAGLVFVNGNVVMNSGTISGTLVSTGSVTLREVIW